VAPTHKRDETTTAGCSCCRRIAEKEREREKREGEKAEINDLTFGIYLYKDIYRKTNGEKEMKISSYSV
jgi:hypothetical protein